MRLTTHHTRDFGTFIWSIRNGITSVGESSGGNDDDSFLPQVLDQADDPDFASFGASRRTAI